MRCVLLLALLMSYVASAHGEPADIFLNGVPVPELAPYMDYLQANLHYCCHGESLSFHAPVREVYRRGWGEHCILQEVDGLIRLLPWEVPVFWAGKKIAINKIPHGTPGLLILGKNEAPALLFFFDQGFWGRVLEISTAHSAVLLLLEGRPPRKQWVVISDNVWDEGEWCREGDILLLYGDLYKANVGKIIQGQ